MNILIINQSVADMCASFFTLLIAVAEVDGTRMSRDSIYDQFVCRMWLTRSPLFNFLFTSTFNILFMTVERYAAVIYHVWYHNNVRTASVMLKFQCLHIMKISSSLSINVHLLICVLLGRPTYLSAELGFTVILSSFSFFFFFVSPRTLRTR